MEKHVPRTPEKAPNKRYRVPISLWLVEKNHLLIMFFTQLTKSKTLSDFGFYIYKYYSKIISDIKNYFLILSPSIGE